MDDLTITDREGDSFTLSESDGQAVLDPPEGTQVRVSGKAAAEMVAWLRECFGSDSDLERAAGFGQTLTVTAGEVSWMGDDSPPAWLEQLARTVLGDKQEQYRLDVMRSVREVLRRSGFNPESGGVELCVRELADRNERNYAALRALVDDLGGGTTADAHEQIKRLTDMGRYRDVLKVLGAETPEVATEIAQTWRTWLDEAGRALISAGVADVTAQTVIDPVKAIGTLLNQQAAAYKKQTQYWSDRERQIRVECAQALGSAVAREREARAAVQVQLSKAERALKAAREGVEYARAQFFDQEENVTSADWPASVSAGIVARLDLALEASAPAS
jgi:hypothetical protein